MAGDEPNSPTIHILDPAVARKIAAGEVIDRPAAVVRELLDNSLDARASRLEVDLVGGGTQLVRVVDDGEGMGHADLERCFLAHATSKITTDDDLLRVRSLGFRGEALSSIAAVSRLEITSAVAAGSPYRVRIEGGALVANGPAAARSGTSVSVADLFYNVPARRHFQKRSASEFAVARAVLLDRALAFPETEFRLMSDGEMRLFIPPGKLIDRITTAYPQHTEPALLHELEATGEGFTVRLIAGEPSGARRDRKAIQVFVNRRRIWEYALVQAVEYAYRDYLHGGLYPAAYLFLDIAPELVDFNIHPAKREVRFRNLPEIHRRVVAALTNYLHVFKTQAVSYDRELAYVGQAGEPRQTYDLSRTFTPSPAISYETASHETEAVSAAVSVRDEGTPDQGAPFRYLGQIMGLFLVVERSDRLYLVDQHAAHERIIYDRLRNGRSGQELLFPVRLEIEPDAETLLRSKQEALVRLGIEVEQRDGGWELTTVPSSVPIEAETLAALLMDLLERPADFERELYASLSCRSAVMDGARLAPEDAIRILESVMALDNARCPHGRPIWIELSRDELCSLVGRT